MKKWLPAIFILAAALIFFGVISLPHTGLPHSRAESLQWDGGSPVSYTHLTLPTILLV